MVSGIPLKNKLFLEILPKATKQAFFACQKLEIFNNSKWYLAGGTALALQVGHRQSVDLDFFTTISQRGRKRDFLDLYWYCQNKEALTEIILRVSKQYPGQEHNINHILKSLLYFKDAEEDPMPKIFFSADWKQIKKYFQKEVPNITNFFF